MVRWDRASLCGWGRLTYAEVAASRIGNISQAVEALNEVQSEGAIVFANGRSYGDVALNSSGQALLTSGFSRRKGLDSQTATIVCDPGVTFHELLREFLPLGFLVPVTPGTGFATIGGAVANDVHGKNHDLAGSFGDHVLWLEQLLPSGEIKRVSKKETPELFAATIGGVGLTGILLSICFKMQRVSGNSVVSREERIPNLDHFFEAFERTRATATYSVGWVDALAKGKNLGRGIFETAELSETMLTDVIPKSRRVPIDFPNFVLNSASIRMFNHAYFRRVPVGGWQKQLLLEKFLYPLDSILEWNRIYGKRGFYQFQCVIPEESGYQGIRTLLEYIAQSGSGSFLAVLKTMGGEGEGYLSFPMRGLTLALDFPNKLRIADLLKHLEKITLDHGGRIYLAKDACLSAEGFATMYPKLSQFRQVLDTIDPMHRMNSDMARRLKIHSENKNGQDK